MMRTTAEIVHFQKKQEAKFICSACGADRACNCIAPAVEKLAAEKERQRVKAKAWRENKKHKKHQAWRTGTDAEMPTEEEADQSYQETLYDQACLFLESMTDETRRRFFAYMKGKYDVS